MFKENSTTRMTTTKQYDFLNRVQSIGSVGASSASSLTFAYTYNDANQRTRVNLADGSFWIYEYDALGQVKSGKRYWSDWTPVAGQQFEYGFDDIGNRNTTKSGGDENGADLRQASYTVNNLNQYTQRTVPGYADIKGLALATNSVTVNSQTPYRRGEYFRKELSVGNGSASIWQSITVAAPTETSVTGNIYVPETPEAFTHDLDGNLTSDGRWDYAWDAENRLVRMVANTSVGPQQLIQFEYDWKGRRIHKQVWNNTAGTGSPALDLRYIYDGWNLMAEIDTNEEWVRQYMWGLDLSGTIQGAGGVGGLVKVFERTGATHNFVGYDGNGNVSVLVNGANGNVSARYEYGPFGEPIRVTGTLAKSNPFRFSTKYQDDESDLIYYGYRYYDQSTGRWLSRDPLEENASENIYAFIFNSPIRFIDILGLSCDASYSFDDDPWWEKPAYVSGTKWTHTLDDVKKDMLARVNAGCCCFQNIYFTEHNGVPGTLVLAGDTISPTILRTLQDAANQAAQKIAQDITKHQREFLQFVSKHMCKGGKVTFVECQSGTGPDGKALQTWLDSLFGPNVNVTLFSGDVKWFYGSPKCTTK